MLSAECVLGKRVGGEIEGDTGAILENNDFDLHDLHSACCGGSAQRQPIFFFYISLISFSLLFFKLR